MRKKIIFITILIVIFTVSGIALSEVLNKKKKAELYQQVGLFSDALAIIQTDYYEEIDSKKLIYGALKGMLSSLDMHSQFLEPEDYNELKVDTEGKFGGLGIEIVMKDGLLTVVTPVEDTPAWKAGIKPGDKIVKINDEITRDMDMTGAIKRLRGKPGEFVNISVLRESESKILEFKIARDIIVIKDIKDVRILEDGIAYIRLVEFSENTPEDIKKALDKLTKEGMSALVIDVRSNPGGLLDAAVKICEQFIEKGKLIVYTKGRKSIQNLEFVSHANAPILDLPVAILINEGSASGSEILAACLQDYKRAVVIGIKSFGKGSVQTIVPLSDGSALRLTTSKYFTPSGKEIHGKGVMPDIVVEDGLIKQLKVSDIEEEKIKEEAFQKVETKSKEKDAFDYKSDNQLMHAIDAIKAIRIYRSK